MVRWIASLGAIIAVLLVVPVLALSRHGLSGQIAFTSQRDGNSDIYLFDLALLRLRNVTNSATQEYNPDWSPDGTQLAFVFVRGASMEIGVMEATGGQRRALTDDYTDDITPLWSSDGQRIVYSSYRNGNSDIYLSDFACDPCTQRLTLTVGLDLLPDWSPDGQHIVFASDRDGDLDIYVMSRSCADSPAGAACSAHNLTHNDMADGSPAWSPNGRWIAFVSQQPSALDLFVMDIEGENVRRLTDNPESERHPIWSPDSRWLAFEAVVEGVPGIYLMDVACACVQPLTPDVVQDAGYAWSPDSRAMVYFHGDGFYLADIERHLSVRLFNAAPQDAHPVWHP